MNVHDASVNEACGLVCYQHTALSITPRNPRRLLPLKQPGTAVSNRQVPHHRPTRVDSHLNRVIVPFKGLLNTSDVTR